MNGTQSYSIIHTTHFSTLSTITKTLSSVIRTAGTTHAASSSVAMRGPVDPPRGRGRGRGSRRDRGRGRGGGRRGATQHRRAPTQYPSQGWRMSSPEKTRLQLEAEFIADVISERARLFCESPVDKFTVERTVREHPDSKMGFVLVFANGLLRTCRTWLKEHVLSNHRKVQRVSISEIYQYAAVLLLSHCTGFSFEKVIVENSFNTADDCQSI